ncbi:MAG TPA: hypothetical protein PKO36_14090, partial [Candidatus Hydrogenedentes bacterium]|nr:hypothetical protein [Candidatus Hydrogenedentota bacterium]
SRAFILYPRFHHGGVIGRQRVLPADAEGPLADPRRVEHRPGPHLRELRVRKKPGPVPEGVSPMLHIDVQPLPVVRDEPLKLELASFIDCVRTRARPVVSGEDGLAAMRLAQDIVDFIREHP